jgi:hypothetical protein
MNRTLMPKASGVGTAGLAGTPWLMTAALSGSHPKLSIWPEAQGLD